MGLYYALGSLVVFYVLLIGEFFVPSGGLIGIAAVVTAITTVCLGFAHSSTTGLAILGVMALSTPVILYCMILMWPHTPIGRRILNRKPGQLSPKKEHRMRDGTPINSLVGQFGITKSDLLPGGLVLINDQRLDAVSTGPAIDAGTPVVVVKTQAGKIHVRAATDEERGSAQGNLSDDRQDSVPLDESAGLEGTGLESLDFDAFD